MARIELNNVSLDFHVRSHGRITFKEFVLRNLFRRTRVPTRTVVHALQDINLEIREGDRLAIIGHNGAGKSTLLKMLAGIYPPTIGTRHVEGRISSLFDLVLGFELDGSGWENIAYRSYLQGETPHQLREKINGIAEFTELGDFLNMPVRYYSAGMMVRLAFAIATAVDPEILLVDEVLSVGDLAFQKKARRRMEEMMSKARLIVMVSHDLVSMAQLCNRAIWLDHGRIRAFGSVAELAAAYTTHSQCAMPDSGPSASADSSKRPPANGQVRPTAYWSFRDLPAGLYEIMATWPPGTDRAANAPYHVYDGSRLLGVVRVDQRQSPLGERVEGKIFQNLGCFRITSRELRVEMSNDADGQTHADLLRVIQARSGSFAVLGPGMPGFHLDGAGWRSWWGRLDHVERVDFVNAGIGTHIANWEWAGLDDGEYEVQVKWLPHPGRTTNALYQIYDGNELVSSCSINQQHSPVGELVQGVVFQSLGTIRVRNGMLRLALSNNAKGCLIADAARLLPAPTWSSVILPATPLTDRAPERQAA